MNRNTSILIINVSYIGDVVSSLGATQLLIEKFGNVDFLTQVYFTSILYDEPNISPVTMEEAIHKKYDIIFDFTSSKESRKLLKKLSANIIYGQHKSLRHRLLYSRYYTKTYPRRDQHIVYDFMATIHKYTDKSCPKPQLHAQPSADIPKFQVGLHFGSRNPIRQIPTTLIDTIIKHLRYLDISLVILGDEEENIKQLCLAHGDYPVYRKTSLFELKNTIANLQLFIGPDSGLLHIAAALNIPSIGIYGPNLPSIAGPIGEKVYFVETVHDCRPCNQNIPCPYDIKCLSQINFKDQIEPIIKTIIT